jgi:hypothetical protein
MDGDEYLVGLICILLLFHCFFLKVFSESKSKLVVSRTQTRVIPKQWTPANMVTSGESQSQSLGACIEIS